MPGDSGEESPSIKYQNLNFLPLRMFHQSHLADLATHLTCPVCAPPNKSCCEVILILVLSWCLGLAYTWGLVLWEDREVLSKLIHDEKRNHHEAALKYQHLVGGESHC